MNNKHTKNGVNEISRYFLHKDASRAIAHSLSEGPSVREMVIQASSADDSVHRPPISQTQREAQCAVKVTGISRGTSQELLLNYLENSRRSHGGPVADLVFKPSLNMAFVTFESAAGERRMDALLVLFLYLYMYLYLYLYLCLCLYLYLLLLLFVLCDRPNEGSL